MRRRWPAALVLVAVAAGCGSGTGAVKPPPARPALTALPPAVAAACRQAAPAVGFAVLCPTVWPPTASRRPPSLRWITRTSRVYLLSALNGIDDRGPHVFHLLVGGQSQPFGPGWRAIDPGLRVTTRLVRIPVRGGGTFVSERPARRIGRAVVHGAAALLLREPDYPAGGLQGGHVLVLWSQAGHGYLVSVHGAAGTTTPSLVDVALALARSTSRP
jgi:hypothetical protein